MLIEEGGFTGSHAVLALTRDRDANIYVLYSPRPVGLMEQTMDREGDRLRSLRSRDELTKRGREISRWNGTRFYCGTVQSAHS